MPKATLLYGMYVCEVRDYTLDNLNHRFEDVIDEKNTKPELVCQNPTLLWREVPWKKVELFVFKLQKRIYKASNGGDIKRVRRLQKLMVRSWYAKLLAVRKVTQENKGKNTAGVDGIKSLTPKQRFELVSTLKLDGKATPTRRVWIPKTSKKEMRPLGIPTIRERAKQALLKLALEPEWEARFEENSFGFRPGRCTHDAIKAIFLSIRCKPKFVLDADISRCFDCINHKALLKKLNTRPSFTRQIKAWLKAGVIDYSKWAERKGYQETFEGTPQGGILSPLLANIALHGLENNIKETFVCDKSGYIKGAKKRYGRKEISQPQVIRYADDFVILCDELSVVQECQEIISNWLHDMGLELKPSKTRLAHTLNEYNGEKPGFDFLGFNIRQHQVGKHHSGKDGHSRLLGFKTIIQPSQKNIQAHYQALVQLCYKLRSFNQIELIVRLNPIIRGWCNYVSPWHSKKVFNKLDCFMWNRLWRWAKRRHPKKGKKWVAKKYWRSIGGDNWTFASDDQEAKNVLTLLKHAAFPAGFIWVKVEKNRSPFDGDWLYWSTRMGDNYLTLDLQKSRLLKRQQGKCAHCKLTFKPDDNLEKHHLTRKGKGGNYADDNMVLLHLHCHDQIHAISEQEYDNWVLMKNAEIAIAKKKSNVNKRKPTKRGRHK